MLLNALTEKGLQAERAGSTNKMTVYVPENKSEGGRMINPYVFMSPPFIKTWDNPVGMGVKKKKKRRQGLLL